MAPRSPGRSHAGLLIGALAAVLLAVGPAGAEEDRLRWPVRVHTGVAGAVVTVRFEPYGPGPAPGPVTKAADGDGFAGFDLPDHPMPLRSIRATALAPGRVPTRDWLHGGEVTLRLPEGPPIRGRVVDEDGNPIEHALVHAKGGGHDTSGKDGVFECPPRGPGETVLTIGHGAYLNRELTVRPDTATRTIRLERGLSIAGRVRYPDGRPAAGFSLRAELQNKFGRTDGAGRYVLRGLAAGRCVVGCAGQRIEATAGSSGVDFTANRHLVRFRLVDGEGRPFGRADYGYELKVAGPGGGSGGGTTEDGDLGAIDAPTGARFTVHPRVPGHEPGEFAYAVTGAPRPHDVPIALRPAARPAVLHLGVEREGGRHRPWVLVSLMHAEGPRQGHALPGYSCRHVRLDEEGRGRLVGVPVGRHRIRVSTLSPRRTVDGCDLAHEGEISFLRGMTTGHTARIRQGGRLRLAVADPEGRPVRDLIGWLASVGRRFEHLDPWKPLPPGTYELHVGAGKLAAIRQVRVEKGKTTRVDIRLKR